MKYPFLVLLLISGFYACSSTRTMTNTDQAIIKNRDTNAPFRILQTDNKADSLFLRQQSRNVSIPFDAHLRSLIDGLKLTMIAQSGVGIAAPQVGIGCNVFLFARMDKVGEVDASIQPKMLIDVAINPQILKYSDEIICFEGDGCLSIPNRRGNTNRYAWIDVSYYNEAGEQKKERLVGTLREGDFTSVIFQHEYDHLQGILFIDRLCD